MRFDFLAAFGFAVLLTESGALPCSVMRSFGRLGASRHSHPPPRPVGNKRERIMRIIATSADALDIGDKQATQSPRDQQEQSRKPGLFSGLRKGIRLRWGKKAA